METPLLLPNAPAHLLRLHHSASLLTHLFREQHRSQLFLRSAAVWSPPAVTLSIFKKTRPVGTAPPRLVVPFRTNFNSAAPFLNSPPPSRSSRSVVRGPCGHTMDGKKRRPPLADGCCTKRAGDWYFWSSLSLSRFRKNRCR